MKNKNERTFIIASVLLLGLGAMLHEKSFSVLFLLLLWIGSALFGIKINTENESPLNVYNTTSLRGISSLEIMLGHIGIVTGGAFLLPNKKAGVLFVGLFFMLSAYGMAYGVYNKQNYLEGFLTKRIKKIMLPLFVVLSVQYAIYKMCRWEFDIDNLWSSGRWYVFELVCLYVIFWLAYKIIPQYAEGCILIVCVVFVIVAYKIGIDKPWYGSTICFPLGLFYYKCRNNRKSKLYGVFVFATLVVILSVFLLLEEGFVGDVLVRNCTAVLFCEACMYVLTYFRIGNKYTTWLGNYSYEIYLVHPLVITCLSYTNVKNEYFFTLLVTVLTIIMAVFLRKICDSVGITDRAKQLQN